MRTLSREAFRSRTLRRAQTPAEVALWSLLRGRRLDGFKFRRQHPIGPYFADFFCPAALLAIEADGDSHQGRARRDRLRDSFFRRNGIRVLRFSNHQILAAPGLVLAVVRDALSPPLPDRGEGAGGEGIAATPSPVRST